MTEPLVSIDDYQIRHARLVTRSGMFTVYSVPETPTASGHLGGYVLVRETPSQIIALRKFTFLDEAFEALRVADKEGDRAAYEHACGITRVPADPEKP